MIPIGFLGSGLRWPATLSMVLTMVALTLHSTAYAQSSLPPEVRADVLEQQIYDALKRQDLKSVLSALDDYHKLPVTMPPPLIFLEAKAALTMRDPVRAFDSLEQFLKVAQRSDPAYNEALKMYASLDSDQQVKERREAQRQAELDQELARETETREKAVAAGMEVRKEAYRAKREECDRLMDTSRDKQDALTECANKTACYMMSYGKYEDAKHKATLASLRCLNELEALRY